MSIPKGLAIAGQHDLPNHRRSEIYRSAYWTLVQSETILDVHSGKDCGITGKERKIHIRGFAWNDYTNTKVRKDDLKIPVRIAFVHKYVWKDGHSFPGVSEDDHIEKFIETHFKEGDYTHFFFGDNHKPFVWKGKGYQAVNCGSFMRTNVDQINHQPSVWLVDQSGKVTRHKLRAAEKDRWEERVVQAIKSNSFDAEGFLESIQEMGSNTFDFEQILKNAANKANLSKGVVRIVLDALEASR